MGFNGKFLFNNLENNIKSNKEIFIDSNFELKIGKKNKFINDRLFFEYNNKIFLLDGVILNNHELEMEYKTNNWQDTFIKIYKEDNFNFLNKLRGSFCGIIYDKIKKELILFTDQLKSKNIYYTMLKDEFIFSTNLSELAMLNKSKNVLDEDAAYLLLTFGGTLEERTLFENIKKLNFATFLKVDFNKKIFQNQYWMFKNTEDYTITKEKAIEEIERLFRKAIKREYDKDLEYGYSHLVELSAGRDSRMNTWVAHEMGYQNDILNITFSESDELDEKIPKQIAKKLKHEWLFKSLDNGNCCYNIEEIIKITCGEIHYGTVCHANGMMKELNYNNYGILHTGLMGDVVIGVFGDNKKKLMLNNLKYCYSKKLLNKIFIKKDIIKNFYSNEEIFNYINRGLHVTNESSILWPEQNIISPFLDIDLLTFCLKIPYHIRKGNFLYDTWIKKKYPEAAKYSHNGRKIGIKEFDILGRSVPMNQIISRIFKKIKLLKREKGMNPFDEWYETNDKLKIIFDEYYKKNITRLNNYKELQKDCKDLYIKGTAREKAQVIGLLGTLKLYFIN